MLSKKKIEELLEVAVASGNTGMVDSLNSLLKTVEEEVVKKAKKKAVKKRKPRAKKVAKTENYNIDKNVNPDIITNPNQRSGKVQFLGNAFVDDLSAETSDLLFNRQCVFPPKQAPKPPVEYVEYKCNRCNRTYKEYSNAPFSAEYYICNKCGGNG